ncbi:photosystem reaction center subunit H [Bacillus sp. FJAT-42376]|uniref:PRC-barrel domain-containing protein n=1 Tax=Bacillus sp. FJAT-42376 TaxID=2014076 RepID=UPI000F50B91E|nr:PRC-barrel domain-containing protein [Bacillus sp. FJAT-42376]AZB44922.1 photosystem reaction center subunit H [Bacillus sp. FJAT-42376]
MKKSIEIVGLPIVCITEGTEAGEVKSLVINPEKGTVDFLTVEHAEWQVSVKAIPFKKIVGIGEYAVTIESENSIIDLNEIPIANQLVNKRIKINDTRVMTRKGQLLGEAKEFFVDEDNGLILGLQIGHKEKQVTIASSDVMTFGKDILVVKEDVHFHSAPEELAGQNAVEPEEIVAITIPVSEMPAPAPAEPEIVSEPVFTHEPKSMGYASQPMNDIKEKQLQLLEGKRVLKDIYTKSGHILVKKDSLLTAEAIRHAQEEGPGIIVELSMNVEM